MISIKILEKKFRVVVASVLGLQPFSLVVSIAEESAQEQFREVLKEAFGDPGIKSVWEYQRIVDYPDLGPITAEQLEKIEDQVRSQLLQHAPALPPDAFEKQVGQHLALAKKAAEMSGSYEASGVVSFSFVSPDRWQLINEGTTRDPNFRSEILASSNGRDVLAFYTELKSVFDKSEVLRPQVFFSEASFKPVSDFAPFLPHPTFLEITASNDFEVVHEVKRNQFILRWSGELEGFEGVVEFDGSKNEIRRATLVKEGAISKTWEADGVGGWTFTSALSGGSDTFVATLARLERVENGDIDLGLENALTFTYSGDNVSRSIPREMIIGKTLDDLVLADFAR